MLFTQIHWTRDACKNMAFLIELVTHWYGLIGAGERDFVIRTNVHSAAVCHTKQLRKSCPRGSSRPLISSILFTHFEKTMHTIYTRLFLPTRISFEALLSWAQSVDPSFIFMRPFKYRWCTYVATIPLWPNHRKCVMHFIWLNIYIRRDIQLFTVVKINCIVFCYARINRSNNNVWWTRVSKTTFKGEIGSIAIAGPVNQTLNIIFVVHARFVRGFFRWRSVQKLQRKKRHEKNNACFRWHSASTEFMIHAAWTKQFLLL